MVEFFALRANEVHQPEPASVCCRQLQGGDRMKFTVAMMDRDHRLQSYCATATCSYGTFMDVTQGAEQNLAIQRGIIKNAKAYATLRSDLKRGCVLPPIVLAIKCDFRRSLDEVFSGGDFISLSDDLESIQSDDVYVIDGLQRMNAIRRTSEELDAESRLTFLSRPLRVELWLNISFGAIAYRMLLLNAGQRPMSVKHQVEVLSSKLMDDLGGIEGLDLFRAVDTRRRTQPGQFPLAKIALGFQAWLQGQPNLDLRNSVMEELLADSAVEILGKTVPSGGNSPDSVDGFNRFVRWIVSLDLALGVENISFLGNETVILGIAAAVGAMERNSLLAPRVWPALDHLLANATEGDAASVLALNVFEKLRQGIDSSKINVGLATREMVFNAFKEFIRSAGETTMDTCWQTGAAV